MSTPLTWDPPNPAWTWDFFGLTWDGTQPQTSTHTHTMDNRISAELTSVNKNTILTKLDEIAALLPFLLNLTLEEKSSLPKMSTIRSGMDEAFATEMAAHPELVPGFVDMPEVNKDRALRTALREVFQKLGPLCEAVDDTQTAAGVDTYLAYLSFYSNVKQAAKRNVPGANTILDNLKRFFPRGGSGGPVTPTPPTP
jgi:hypothetical protein